MKRFKTKEFEIDNKICDDSSPLHMARSVRSIISEKEGLHYHSEAHEYYIFLKGKARLKVNDSIFEVGAGDVIMVEPKEPHRIMEILEKIDFMVVRTSTKNDRVALE